MLKSAVLAVALLLASQVSGRTLQQREEVLDTTYYTLIRVNDERPSLTMGKTLKLGATFGKGMKPVLSSAGQQLVAITPDYTSYHRTASGIYTIVQFEASPAPYYVLSVEQNKDGHMRVNSMEPVDISEWDGSIRPCAGSTSPWNTHIGGEESYPDVRGFSTRLEPTPANIDYAAGNSDVKTILNWQGIYLAGSNAANNAALKAAAENIGAKYLTADQKSVWHEHFRKDFKPYMIGHIFEISVDNKGKASYQKHLALGRSSFETAYVMPDEKTVYLTDDSAGGGLMKFVMDKKGDLSKGTLYAGKFKQTTPNGSEDPQFDITWIEMSKMDHDILLEAARKPLTEFNFFSIFNTADIKPDGTCPEGFMRVDWNSNPAECLQLNENTPNVRMLAAGLETRRFITYVGATSEFTKMEGLTFDENNSKLYMAISYQRGPMATNVPAGGQDDIRIKLNLCGCTYALSVDKSYSATDMKVQVCGKEIKDGNGKVTGCFTDYPANPDNLSMMQDYGWLVISEDSDYHDPNFMMMHNVNTKENIIVAAAEGGVEVTAGWFQDKLYKWSYVTGNFQGFARSPLGYLGPWKLDGVKSITFKSRQPAEEEHPDSPFKFEP